MSKVAPLAALALAALAFTTGASGSGRSSMPLAATLNVAQETPAATGAKSDASGKFTGTLTGTKLKWTLTYAHLTGPATAAHIHGGKKGVAGPVLIALCGPCRSGVSGQSNLTPAQAKQLRNGGTYVNVHTAKNPGGEIRGQIKMTM
jgi:hypothetical protein